MNFKLERFIDAHNDDYARALKEIQNGRKLTHWMWYIFPQITGLGMSETAQYYEIKSLEEARAYMDNEILGTHLIEITNALLELNTNNPIEVFGDIDSLKLKSSMTLFDYVSNNEIFSKVIDKYFSGLKDQTTIKICKEMKVSNLLSNYTFENFVISNSNKSIVNYCMEVANNPGKLNNPLFIYGKSGLGKTHLIHAIGNHIVKDNSTLNILYITSDVFTKEYVDVTKSNNAENYNEFRNRYQSVDVLIIDDIQYLKGQENTQRELSYIFNDLLSKNKQIVITSNQSLNSIKLLETLHKCIDLGTEINLVQPDYELCISIIDKKFESISTLNNISEDVKEYIANNYGSNIRKLEGSITRIMVYSSMINDSNITLSLVIDALKDYK